MNQLKELIRRRNHIFPSSCLNNFKSYSSAQLKTERLRDKIAVITKLS